MTKETKQLSYDHNFDLKYFTIRPTKSNSMSKYLKFENLEIENYPREWKLILNLKFETEKEIS